MFAAADSRRRSSPLRGSPPFSGANAAGGYLPLHHSGIMIFQPTLVAGESTFYFSGWDLKSLIIRYM